MLRFLKNLFNRSDAAPCGVAEAQAASPAFETVAPRLASTAQPSDSALIAHPPPEERPLRDSAPLVAGVVKIPVKAILSGADDSLRQALTPHAQRDLLVPVNRIMPQLNCGSVVLPLGELRRLSPGILRDTPLEDDLQVALPLDEILKQLGPEHYGRRASQRKIAVPDEVIGPFGANGRLINITPPPVNGASSSAQALAVSGPVTAPSIPGHAKPVAPSSQPVSGKALPSLSDLKPTVAVPAEPSQAPPIKPAMPGASAVRLTCPLPGATALTVPRAAASSQALPMPSTAASRAPSATLPFRPSAAPDTAPLLVPLAEASQHWPTLIRNEVVSMSIGASQVALPFDIARQALQNGVLQFKWQQVFDWLQPPPASTPSSETAGMTVDLPLPLVAPMFMARVEKPALRKPSAVAGDIPEMFGRDGKNGWSLAGQNQNASAPPLSHAAGAPRPTLPSYPTASHPASQVRPASAPAAPEFIDLNAVMGPSNNRFQARDIVLNVSKLPGALGALLAMSDGLLVTSAVSPKVKSEMLAAFLPQIFGRMNQYAREIGMSAVSTLSFTVEDGVWQVLRQSNIFLAVLCRHDQALPPGPLAGIAAELNKQKQ